MHWDRCQLEISLLLLTHLMIQMQEEEDRVLKEHEEQLLKDLKEAVRAEKEGRKITRQTKPAIVLENREPPEIPEFKMEEPLPSNLTGEDAIWYMFRLSLFVRMQQAKREEMEKEREREKASELEIVEEEGGQNGAASGEETDKVVSESEMGEATTADMVAKGEREGEISNKDTANDSPDKNDKSDASIKSTGSSSGGTKKSKTKSKKSSKKKAASTPPPAPRPIDNQQSFERDPEVERILNEVVETLNRNQTPVQRKIPSRVIPRSPDQFRGNSDEIRIRHSPRARPWPTLDECQDKPLPRFLVFTSTWLSVTAKGVK